MKDGSSKWFVLLGAPMLLLLALPLLALVGAVSSETLRAGLEEPAFGEALGLSLRTSLVSIVLIVAFGAPLAWSLSRLPEKKARFIEVFVELPMVLPPAVVGLGLLYAFSRRGLWGQTWGESLAFSSTAVVLAQIVIGAPLFVQSATAAFRRVDPELLLVARTLGQTGVGSMARVAWPIAWPGLVTGIALAWARALGEFGATLLFAGNLPGVSQTMPLAIYNALESDLDVALALGLLLATAGGGVLLFVRLVFRGHR